MELEATARMLEELEWIAAGEVRATEWVSSLLAACRIIGVLSVVEALSQFWIRQNLVRLVDCCHLRFATALVWMCLLCCSPAGKTSINTIRSCGSCNTH